MEKCKNCNKWLGYGEKCNCNNNYTTNTSSPITIGSLFEDTTSSSSSSDNSSSSNNNSFDGFGGGDFGGGGSSGDF